jgi:hypothetical protein
LNSIKTKRLSITTIDLHLVTEKATCIGSIKQKETRQEKTEL